MKVDEKHLDVVRKDEEERGMRPGWERRVQWKGVGGIQRYVCNNILLSGQKP